MADINSIRNKFEVQIAIEAYESAVQLVHEADQRIFDDGSPEAEAEFGVFVSAQYTAYEALIHAPAYSDQDMAEKARTIFASEEFQGNEMPEEHYRALARTWGRATLG